MKLLQLSLCALVLFSSAARAHTDSEPLFFVKAMAKDKTERTRLTSLGIAIDGVLSDSVTFLATEAEIARARRAGFRLEVANLPRTPAFPEGDKAFHTYEQVNQELDKLVAARSGLVQKFSIGKSLEGRDLFGVRLSSKEAKDSLPTAIFLGCHHAREHLSVEVPLKLAQYLVANYPKDERVRNLLDTREVYIIPMVNPDGAEHDISNGSYRYWRKNRRENGDGTFGVDLNRNYGGPNWGGEGASTSPGSDIYAGSSGFSEPETQAVRDFVKARKHTTVLLTFHTYSELVLWPWGYTNDTLSNEKDRKVFETMGNKMAEWNKYKPEKSSELYITSGDTTDWAYDSLKIFAFTFELSPSSMFGGGFYPGAKAIEPTFQANLEPALYLIDLADNPYRVAEKPRDPLGLR